MQQRIGVRVNNAELVGISDSDQAVRILHDNSGMATDAVNQAIDNLIEGQGFMLSSNQMT